GTARRLLLRYHCLVASLRLWGGGAPHLGGAAKWRFDVAARSHWREPATSERLRLPGAAEREVGACDRPVSQGRRSGSGPRPIYDVREPGVAGGHVVPAWLDGRNGRRQSRI